MGDVIEFIPKSERERGRLIREAREIYDSIFPPAYPTSGQDKAPANQAITSHAINGASAYRRDRFLLS